MPGSVRCSSACACFSHFSINFYGTCEIGLVFTDKTMACYISIKKMRIIKNPLCGETRPLVLLCHDRPAAARRCACFFHLGPVEIFIFTLFYWYFLIFPYIILVNFCFQATGHSFSPTNVILGLRVACSNTNWIACRFFF